MPLRSRKHHLRWTVGNPPVFSGWVVHIEVDGEQHYTNKGLEHDKIRTDRLMQCGWKLVKRIRWSQFQKLNKDERKQFINEVFMLLNNDAS